MTEKREAPAPPLQVRRRRASRLTIPNGFRKRFLKLGYRITRRRIRYFFESPSVWLITPIERSESKMEGSRVPFPIFETPGF